MLSSTAFGRSASLLLVAAAFGSLVFAVDTRIWDQSDESDFSRGTVKQLSIRSDGRVSLAPEFKELDSTTIPYLWTIAQDSKGTLYYAGGAPTGATTSVIALQPGGKSKTFAEISGLEIHALAVDSQDRVYAAVQPDAKIYRIDKSGKASLFFDPKQKYIWSILFDKSGNLFVATADSGLIYKVTPDGKGSEFANTQETHARSMILDSAGDLIVGTEPGGLVVRIRPNGERFVLYQTNKREVTALAEYNGAFYAAAVGNKSGALQVAGPAPVLPSNPQPVSGAGQARVATAPPAQPPALTALSVAVSGGSEVYRIQKDGFAERIWQSGSDLVYALAFDGAGHPLLGTGNRGIIYRIDSEQLATQLLNSPPTQVTAFLAGRHKEIFAVTGNVGNVYSIGPELAQTGSIESDVLDAGEFSYWGRAHTTTLTNGGSVNLQARSGNLNNPQHDWSAWSDVENSPKGGEVHAPAARFLQYRLTLKRSPAGESPVVSAVDIPFLSRNVAPRVTQVEVEPLNYREAPSSVPLERAVMSSGSPMTISVPAVGQKRSPSAGGSMDAAPAATLQYSKSYQTVRWSASDPDGDTLQFRVEVKPRKGERWTTLKEKLQDRYFSFDTSAFPDGEYILRITSSDAPGNVEGEALSSSLESDPFTIDNTPPEISDVKKAVESKVSFTAKDALSWIAKAEYSVEGGEWTLLEPVNRVTDSQVLSYQVPVPAGKSVAVRVFDEADNVAVRQLAP